MKQTRKFYRVCALLLAILLVSLAFVGCEEPADADVETSSEAEESSSQGSVEGYATVVLEGEPETEYRVDLDKVEGDTLLSVLAYLEAEEGLSYKLDGTLLTEVGSVKQDPAAGIYLYLFTSVESDWDVSVYATTKEYGDMTLNSAGVGALEMRVCDGAVLYIGTISWA